MDSIIISSVTIQDAEKLLQIYAPYILNTAITFEYEVPTVSEFQERIKTISSKFPYLKAVAGQEIIGYAYANTFKNRPAYNRAVESTIYIAGNYRQHGLGRCLYGELEKRLKAMGILNMNASVATAAPGDPYLTDASLQFHKKMGFSEVGSFHQIGYKFKRWYGLTWLEKMLGPHEETNG